VNGFGYAVRVAGKPGRTDMKLWKNGGSFCFYYNDPKQRTGLRPTVQNRYIFSDKVMHEVFNGGWESFENGGALRS